MKLREDLKEKSRLLGLCGAKLKILLSRSLFSDFLDLSTASSLVLQAYEQQTSVYAGQFEKLQRYWHTTQKDRSASALSASDTFSEMLKR